MRTRPKVLLTVSLSLLILFLGLYEVISFQLIRTYTNFEREIASEDVLRAADALQSRVTDLETKIGDWAQWDDTYQYVKERNEEYISSNLNKESFAILKVEMVAITDEAGDIIFSKRVEDGAELQFPESLRDQIITRTDLHDPSVEKVVSGIVDISEGVAIFASRPITTSDGSAQSVGRIFFAYLIDDQVQEALALLTHLDLQLERYDEASDDSIAKRNASALEDGKVFIPETNVSEEHLVGTILMSEALSGNPALIVTVTMPREILALQASHSIHSKNSAGVRKLRSSPA